jgi:SAM-dependent methyltransferase
MSIALRISDFMRRPLELVEDNLRRPTGWAGRLVGHAMALQHRSLTRWAIDQMDVTPFDSVLDMGCGGGMAIKLLSRVTPEGFVAGLDYSQDMVRQACRRNRAAIARARVGIKHGDAMEMPYGDMVFDRVCAIETFYFWPDPARGLEEALRVLKPGGRLTIALEMSKEAAPKSSPLQRYFGRSFTERSARQGLRILSGEELTDLMRRAGFVQTRFVSQPTRSLGWLCAVGTR